jgi:hypothetical protein
VGSRGWGGPQITLPFSAKVVAEVPIKSPRVMEPCNH